MNEDIKKWIEMWKKDIKRCSVSLRGKYNEDKLNEWSKEDLLSIIYDLVNQHCCKFGNEKECDTSALTSDAEAFAVLGDVGLIKINSACCRMAVGEIKNLYGDDKNE